MNLANQIKLKKNKYKLSIDKQNLKKIYLGKFLLKINLIKKKNYIIKIIKVIKKISFNK